MIYALLFCHYHVLIIDCHRSLCSFSVLLIHILPVVFSCSPIAQACLRSSVINRRPPPSWWAWSWLMLIGWMAANDLSGPIELFDQHIVLFSSLCVTILVSSTGKASFPGPCVLCYYPLLFVSAVQLRCFVECRFVIVIVLWPGLEDLLFVQARFTIAIIDGYHSWMFVLRHDVVLAVSVYVHIHNQGQRVYWYTSGYQAPMCVANGIDWMVSKCTMIII